MFSHRELPMWRTSSQSSSSSVPRAAKRLTTFPRPLDPSPDNKRAQRLSIKKLTNIHPSFNDIKWTESSAIVPRSVINNSVLPFREAALSPVLSPLSSSAVPSPSESSESTSDSSFSSTSDSGSGFAPRIYIRRKLILVLIFHRRDIIMERDGTNLKNFIDKSFVGL